MPMEQKKSIKEKLITQSLRYIKSLFFKVADLNVGISIENDDEDHFVRVNVIDRGSEINGDCVFDHNCRISGVINGDVVCVNKVVIDSNGYVNGNIYCSRLIIDGTITKNIYCEGKTTLTKNAKVLGDIYSVKIEVPPEANFRGVISKENINDIEKHWNNRIKK